MHDKCGDAMLSLITSGWVSVYIVHACSYCTDVLEVLSQNICHEGFCQEN